MTSRTHWLCKRRVGCPLYPLSPSQLLYVYITIVCRKLSKVNGQLNPESKKAGSKDKLSNLHTEYRAAWLGSDNQYSSSYKDLRELCDKADKKQLKWSATVPASDLPAAWVSLHCVCVQRCVSRWSRCHAMQAAVLPSKETKKAAIAAAAAQLVKAAVISQAPSSRISSDTTGQLESVTRSANPRRLPAHDNNGQLLPGFVTQDRMAKVWQTCSNCHDVHGDHSGITHTLRVRLQLFGKVPLTPMDHNTGKKREANESKEDYSSSEEQSEEDADDQEEEVADSPAKPSKPDKASQANKNSTQSRKRTRTSRAKAKGGKENKSDKKNKTVP